MMEKKMRISLGLMTTSMMAILCGPSLAQAPGPALPPEYRAYLAKPDVDRRQVSPSASEGSALDKADRSIFRERGKLDGTARWTMAISDSGRGALKAFSCAAGVSLTNDNAPALVKLLSRYRTDLINVTRERQDAATPRPFQRDKGPVCIADKALATATGTPLIQSAWGWTLSLILSEALPDRTNALMARGRAYGESAAICGFASASEVAAGRDLASAMLSRSRSEPEFTADLDKAKAEIRALALSGTSRPSDCAEEQAAFSTASY